MQIISKRRKKFRKKGHISKIFEKNRANSKILVWLNLGGNSISKGLRLTPPPCSPMLKIPCLLFPLQRVFFRSHEGHEWPQKAVFHQVRRRSRVSDRHWKICQFDRCWELALASLASVLKWQAVFQSQIWSSTNWSDCWVFWALVNSIFHLGLLFGAQFLVQHANYLEHQAKQHHFVV